MHNFCVTWNFKKLLIWAFLGTSADESVPPAGYSLATRGIAVAGRDPKKVPVARAGSTFALHGRTWAPLEPSWNQLEPACGQLGVCLSQLEINLVELDAICDEFDATLGTENMTKQ